jgi:hypothetical protein
LTSRIGTFAGRPSQSIIQRFRFRCHWSCLEQALIWRFGREASERPAGTPAVLVAAGPVQRRPLCSRRYRGCSRSGVESCPTVWRAVLAFVEVMPSLRCRGTASASAVRTCCIGDALAEQSDGSVATSQLVEPACAPRSRSRGLLKRIRACIDTSAEHQESTMVAGRKGASVWAGCAYWTIGARG